MLVYAKAIVGALVSGLGSLGTALADGHLSAAEGAGVALATVVSFAAVYQVPNLPRLAPAKRRPPTTHTKLPG